MELLITQHNNGEITFNADELKAQIAAFVDEYKGIVYTDENIKDAKKDRTEVRKRITAIEDRRKEIKKAYMDRYNKFEKEVKTCLEPLTQLEGNLKDLADEYEKKRQDEKMEQVKELFAEIDYPFPVPLEAVFRNQWMNASFSMKEIKQEMLDFGLKVRNDIDIIERLPNSFEAKEVYKRTFDVARALDEADKIAKIQAAKEETQRRAEEQKRQEQQAVIHAAESRESLTEAHFIVIGTIPQLREIKECMDTLGVRYEVTDDGSFENREGMGGAFH